MSEIKEETGLVTKVKRLIGVYSKHHDNEIVFSFECEITGGKIELSSEADKIEYFELREIPRNISPRQLERIQNLFEGQSKTLLKKQ